MMAIKAVIKIDNNLCNHLTIGAIREAKTILPELSFWGQFPAPIEPWPLSGILSDEILDALRKFCCQQLYIFLLVGCPFYFDRTSDKQCLRDPSFSHDEHGQDRSACFQRKDGGSRRGIGCLPEERDRNSPRLFCSSVTR